MTVKNQWLPTIQQEQDVMLMDYFISFKYKHTELAVLNKCRVYLQVLSLTDITSADGRRLIPHNRLHILSQDRKSILTWQQAWLLW
jgi:hypothetical protein